MSTICSAQSAVMRTHAGLASARKNISLPVFAARYVHSPTVSPRHCACRWTLACFFQLTDAHPNDEDPRARHEAADYNTIYASVS